MHELNESFVACFAPVSDVAASADTNDSSPVPVLMIHVRLLYGYTDARVSLATCSAIEIKNRKSERLLKSGLARRGLSLDAL